MKNLLACVTIGSMLAVIETRLFDQAWSGVLSHLWWFAAGWYVDDMWRWLRTWRSS